MKILTLAIIGLFLFAPICLGISEQELLEAEETLRQMSSVIGELRGFVQEAVAMKVGKIILTEEQRQFLIDEYLDLKTQLPDLYDLLP